MSEITWFQMLLENADKIGAVVISVFVMVWALHNNQKNISKIIDDNTKVTKGIIDVLDEHIKKDDAHFDKLGDRLDKMVGVVGSKMNSLGMKLGNTAMTSQQTLNLFEEKLWFVSFGKIEFIKHTMAGNLEQSKEYLTPMVTAELMNQSGKYMEDFAEFITPVGDLSEWLGKNFTEEDFISFINKIVTIMLKERHRTLSKEDNIELAGNEVGFVMKTLHNKLKTKLRHDLANNK